MSKNHPLRGHNPPADLPTTFPVHLMDRLSYRILTLPFDAYARLLAQLLEQLGYQQVHLTGRTDWKGRNRGGGYDLTAYLPGGLAPRKVIVQVKQFDSATRLFQRHVDELRGAALRAGASEAILVTTGGVSPSVDTAGLSVSLLPLRLIDGDALLRLLIRYSVGVSGNELDEPLLDKLARQAQGNSREDCVGRSGLVVKVQVVKLSRRGETPVRQTTLPTLF